MKTIEPPKEGFNAYNRNHEQANNNDYKPKKRVNLHENF